MKEAFEKIIERLKLPQGVAKRCLDFKVAKAYGNAIEIVNQVAEECAEKEFSEWCHDCPAYDKENHHCPRFCKVIRTTVEEIKEGYNREWIPCSERLPENTDNVIITTVYGVVLMAFIATNKKWCYLNGKRIIDSQDAPIAWQPLPEPYKPKGE